VTTLRVLYDASTLGIGHLYAMSRGGGFRVDEHLLQGLASSPECELLLCANHSSVAYHGCAEYLRAHPAMGGVALLGPRGGGPPSALRRVALDAHRWARRMLRSHVFPRALRNGAKRLDGRIHPPVADASPPADVFHSAGTPLPPRARPGGPRRRFLSVYDLAYLRFPELYGAEYRATLEAALASVRDDDRVMTCSGSTRDQLVERGLFPAERIVVVPLAACGRRFRPACPERIAQARARYGIGEGPYILSVNTPDPRKNLQHAVRSFARLVSEHALPGLTLVLVGHAGLGPQTLREAVDGLPAARGRVVLTGYVRDDDLAPLYCGATAFVYPSLYEGFGLSTLEAMQCGTPVVASRTSSLPEVVGDAGILVPPGDGDALCQAMLDLAGDAGLRARLSERSLSRAATFSWERSTRETLSAYRAALAA
jgi:glycosyltransferase involved in cell wall biosynthesis